MAMTDFTRPSVNRQVVLVRRPSGIPLASDFTIVEAPVPVPDAGRFLVRTIHLSADPVQRGWAASEALTPLGAPFRALAVGIVVDSRAPGIEAGHLVYGFFGWQDYAVAGPDDLLSHVPDPRAPAAAYAGVLGMPGVTAWLALQDLAPPGPADTILVSTAAGAVGSVVGQIARQRGARVVGLTSSAGKIERCVTRFGYHEAHDYRAGDLSRTLAEACPTGFTIYFDNTGGPILDTAIRAMAKYGRIIQCGTAATPAWAPPPTGLRNEREILTRVLTWSGFYIFDHVARFGEAIESLTALMLAGQLDHDEDIDEGLARAPHALEALFAGANAGKKLIHVGGE